MMDRTNLVAWVIVGGLVCLPWLTWVPITSSNPHHAVTQTPFWGFVLLGLLGLSLLIAVRDPWLGSLAGWMVLRSAPATHATGFETVFVLILGALMLAIVQQVATFQRQRIIEVLLIGGVIQVVYVLVQWLGYDPMWGGTGGDLRMTGTLGNSTYVAAWLAMLVPLAPVWMVPIFLVGIVLTQSVMGLLAGVAGLLVAWRLSWKQWVLTMAGSAMAILLYPHVWASWITRWKVWEHALTDQTWWSVVIGHGPGAWVAHPRWQWGELFLQVHNDYLQLFYEGGLVALALVAGWLWANQQKLAASPVAGAVVAVAITAVTMFPFHLAIPGLTAVVILGLATTEAV